MKKKRTQVLQMEVGSSMSEMIRCPRCSHPNAPGSSFCMSCGSDLAGEPARQPRREHRAYEEYTMPAENSWDKSIGKPSADSDLSTAPKRGSRAWLGVLLGLTVAYIAMTLFDSGLIWQYILYHFDISDPDLQRILFLGDNYHNYSSLWNLMRFGFPGILLVICPVIACVLHYAKKKIPAAIFAVLGLSASVPGIITFWNFGIWIALGWIFGAVASLLLLLAILNNRSAKACGFIILGIGAVSMVLTILLSFCRIELVRWNPEEYKAEWVGGDFWRISSRYRNGNLQYRTFSVPLFISSESTRYSTTYFYTEAACTAIPLSRALLCFLMGAGCLAGASWSKEKVTRSASYGAYPAYKIPTNRSLAKMFFLGILTCGIYPAIISCYMVEDINLIASPHDGRRTMHPVAAGMLGFITFGIYSLVWEHGLCNRIRDELNRRNISYRFDASTFWLWCVLGSFILVGPFVFLHKYCTAMNCLADDYNQNG